MKNLQQTLILLGGLAVLLYAAGCAQMPSDASPRSSVQALMEHQVVASKSGSFYAWPANHGVWTWSDDYQNPSKVIKHRKRVVKSESSLSYS